ncbi:N-acetyltransferase [Sphingopyxis sp.]|uniref:GNAT family N-acetyltransferase n=1 Tax=Sphingopyxis sp. TaxID=1908224 RepID=UPI002586BBD7|nr:N-acetyltransferase [Sphingopyxis sp.]
MPDAIAVRRACATDAAAIAAVHREAFTATGFGYQGEAELVAMIEADGDALVSLVAERAGTVAGHILFSRMSVVADGRSLAAAGLAPVAVLPDWQGQGVGGLLIRGGLAALRDQGIALCVVLGDPAYYTRFGFSADLAARFASPFAGEHLMAMMLDPAAVWPVAGRADYAPAFARMG